MMRTSISSPLLLSLLLKYVFSNIVFMDDGSVDGDGDGQRIRKGFLKRG